VRLLPLFSPGAWPRLIRTALLAIGSLGLHGLAAAAPATLFTRFAWHDNVTNAEQPADVLAAGQVLADFTAAHHLVLDRDNSAFLDARLRTEVWPRFDRLNRVFLGARATGQHKFGLGAYAPTLRLALSGDVVPAREADRAGLAGAASAAYRQRLTPTLRLQLTYEIARYDARTLTFDRTGRESTAMLAWQSPTAWQFDLAVAHRRGDVLAYSSPPRPDLVASGKNLVFVDTFGRRSPLIAYYFPADTRSAELGASRFLGRNLTLSVNASWSRTTHGPGAFYLNRVGSLSLQRTF
jgi:hypothetical protein